MNFEFLGEEQRREENQFQMEEDMEDLEENSDMEFEDLPARKKKIKKPENDTVKQYGKNVIAVLKKINFDEKRSSKLHWSDFLQLLLHFNQNQIFFK